MRTKKDPTQIAQFEHDEASNAKRVKMIDTEISMELDHNDGDSVTAHPVNLIVSAIGVNNSDNEVVPPQNVASIKAIKAYVKITSGTPQGTLKLEVSPTDSGDTFYSLAEINAANGMSTPLELMARRLRVMKGEDLGDCELELHIVGQS